jgi:MFS family permease
VSFFDRESTVAPPGYNRWLVPPAALSIHLCIGQGYALSVFNLPMSRLLGITHSAEGDWDLKTTVWMFNIAFFVLGAAALVWGRWLERAGPRKAMFVAALCFSGGLLLASASVALHDLLMLYASFAVYGVGLGLGYISPVSTLIRWFPDRPGMATGMAIMGFGGGAMIGSPLAANLMEHFRTATSTGVAQTFATMGVLYFFFMMFGVITVRVPPSGWAPSGSSPKREKEPLVTSREVTADRAVRTPQFWLLWAVLGLNVTAGIGLLSQASPMIQEMFHPHVSAAGAAGFVGLISLFNLLGRFLWASISDVIGRKATYTIYFVLGTILYCVVPALGGSGHLVLFVVAIGLIFTMYGGGFATIPAYLRDLFGVAQVGAIHGRLLTAWSAAAVTGPVLVTYLRDDRVQRGLAKVEAYSSTMYIMAGLLVLGLVCNLCVKPVDPSHHAGGGA